LVIKIITKLLLISYYGLKRSYTFINVMINTMIELYISPTKLLLPDVKKSDWKIVFKRLNLLVLKLIKYHHSY